MAAVFLTYRIHERGPRFTLGLEDELLTAAADASSTYGYKSPNWVMYKRVDEDDSTRGHLTELKQTHSEAQLLAMQSVTPQKLARI